MKETSRLKTELKAKSSAERTIESRDYVSTGVTLLDLAISGVQGHGFVKGKCYRVVGRSSSGKTFLCRSILAEAANNTSFDGYELIYDDVEGGALFDTRKFFGKRLEDRLVPPARTKERTAIHSRTVGDFFKRLTRKLEADKKLIWVEDSLDCLNPEPGTESKMSDGKAKAFSQELRKVMAPLESTGSILILVSQAKVDMRSLFGGDTTAGGRSPEFYSTLEIWLSKVKTLKTTYKGVGYNSGSLIQARVKKNRVSGLDRSVRFPFYPSYGIDDLGACVDFLVRSHHWEKASEKGKFHCPELGFFGSRQQIIREVEKHERLDDVRRATTAVWAEITAATGLDRKPRYQ